MGGRGRTAISGLWEVGGSQEVGQTRISLFLSPPKVHGSTGMTKDKARSYDYSPRKLSISLQSDEKCNRS